MRSSRRQTAPAVLASQERLLVDVPLGAKLSGRLSRQRAELAVLASQPPGPSGVWLRQQRVAFVVLASLGRILERS
jgi:hypothetical protein